MSRWTSRRVKVGANPEGKAQAGNDKASFVEVLPPAKEGDRLGIIVEVLPGSSHAVNVSFGDRDASARHAARTLEPGSDLDTTELPASMQPTGRITAYTDETLDQTGQGLPGQLLLNVTEVTAS